MKLFKARCGDFSTWIACKTAERALELAKEQAASRASVLLADKPPQVALYFDGAITIDFEFSHSPKIGEDPVAVANLWTGDGGTSEPDFDLDPEDTASFLAMAIRRQADEIKALKAARDEACEIASDLGNRIPHDGWTERLREIRAVCRPIIVSDEVFDELTAAMAGKP